MIDHADYLIAYSFLLCFWEGILPDIRKASAISGNGGAIAIIRVDFPEYGLYDV